MEAGTRYSKHPQSLLLAAPSSGQAPCGRIAPRIGYLLAARSRVERMPAPAEVQQCLRLRRFGQAWSRLVEPVALMFVEIGVAAGVRIFHPRPRVGVWSNGGPAEPCAGRANSGCNTEDLLECGLVRRWVYIKSFDFGHRPPLFAGTRISRLPFCTFRAGTHPIGRILASEATELFAAPTRTSGPHYTLSLSANMMNAANNEAPLQSTHRMPNEAQAAKCRSSEETNDDTH